MAGDREEQRERLEGLVGRWREDVRAIGAALNGAAVRESWCSQYDEEVREVAGSLQVAGGDFLETAPLRRAYLVDVEVRTTVCVPVEAEDEDEAREHARGLWSEYAHGMEWDVDPLSKTDSGSWSVEEDPDRYA